MWLYIAHLALAQLVGNFFGITFKVKSKRTACLHEVIIRHTVIENIKAHP